MSREENILNNLFEQARNAKTETTVSDIQQWIGFVTIGTLLIGLLAKLKLIVTKSFFMYSSIILSVGLGAGTYFLTQTEHTPEVKTLPVQKEASIYKPVMIQPEEKEEEIVITIDEIQKPFSPVIQESTKTETEPEAPFVQEIVLLELPPVTTEQLPTSVAEPLITNKAVYSFRSIKISGAVNVTLRQGSENNVEIESTPECKDQIVINNKNELLEIYSKATTNSAKDCKINVFVTVTELEKLECSGASDLSSSGELKFKQLELKTSGASDIKLQLNVTAFSTSVSGASDVQLTLTAEKSTVSVSGASDVTISGTTSALELICSGASDLKAEKFKAKDAKITCSGASSSKIHVTDTLEVQVSGASDVKYKGSPTITDKTVTGASKIRQF